MKTLYLIFNNHHDNPTTKKLLLKAAKFKNIDIQLIYSNDFNFIEHKKITSTDGLYRVAIDKRSILVEKFLLSRYSPVTFYSQNIFGFKKFDNVIEATLVHQQAGLPIIKTVYGLTKKRKMLNKYC